MSVPGGSKRWLEQIGRAAEFLSILDDDLRVLYVNHAQPGVGHYVGVSVFDFVGDDYHERLRQTVARARSTGLPQHYESEAAGPNGQRSFYSNWVIRLRVAGGEELFGFIATDVTHRRRIEDALDLSEQTLRAFIEKAPDHIMILDVERRIQFVNRTKHGLEIADVIGVRPEDFVPEPERSKVIDAIERVLHTGCATSYEAIVDLPDGRRHEYSSRVGPIIRDGRVERVAVISTEITAEREAQRERQRLSEQLHRAQKMEAIGQLTGGIAHDFNNLLMVIGGCLEAIQTAPHIEDARSEASQALATTQRAASLTQRLLAFSRKQTLRPEVLDPGELVAGMEELLRRTLGETICVRTVCEPEAARCEVDAAQLENVILNLALNARDAMPGGGELTIRTASVEVTGSDPELIADAGPGHYLVVSVTDTGAGMAPDVLAQAFDPFFTTKEVGRGSGLGLSVAYGFARQSGGTVKIDSEPGEGTRVSVYLPRCDRPVGRISVPASHAHAPGRGEKVLVVEDNRDVRRVLAKMLEALGYAATVASNAEEALSRLQEDPDVALMIADVVLPDPMNGVELTRRARRMNPSLGALLVSGYPRDALDELGHLGCNVDVLSKPFGRETLAEAVWKALANRSGTGA